MAPATRNMAWAVVLATSTTASACSPSAPAAERVPALVAALGPAWNRLQLLARKSESVSPSLVPMRTVEIEDAEFSDLSPLRERLARARVIALGEATHGDGTGWRAKARLVRFLHEALGFDVLAWESGMYDCERMQQDLREGIAAEDAMARGLFPVWAESEEVRRLFDWARTRPLTMVGFDVQFSGTNRGHDFAAWVFAALGEVDPSTFDAARRALLDVALRRLRPDAYRAMDAGERQHDRALFESLLHAIRERRAGLAERLGAAGATTLERTVENTIQLYRWRDASVDGVALSKVPELNNTRDEAMAGNVLWLANERFPGRKIILWTASFHAMRDAAGVGGGRYARFVPMGRRLAEVLGDDYLAVGLTAYQGAWGSGGKLHQLSPALPDSLEAQLHDKAEPYLFVNGRALETSRTARFLGYGTFEAQWGRVFDAAVFVDEMQPAKAPR